MKTDPLANTVLFVLHGLGEHPGLTKLLKLLYFADYYHYREHLSTITGAEYVALERGPVIDGYAQAFDALERRGIVSTREVAVLGHDKPKQEYLALMEPDMDAFSDIELATLKHVLLKHGDMTGVTLSRMTHEEALPWSMVWDTNCPGRRIPFVLFRCLENRASDKDVEVARERAKSA